MLIVLRWGWLRRGLVIPYLQLALTRSRDMVGQLPTSPLRSDFPRLSRYPDLRLESLRSILSRPTKCLIKLSNHAWSPYSRVTNKLYQYTSSQKRQFLRCLYIQTDIEID